MSGAGDCGCRCGCGWRCRWRDDNEFRDDADDEDEDDEAGRAAALRDMESPAPDRVDDDMPAAPTLPFAIVAVDDAVLAPALRLESDDADCCLLLADTSSR